jgi:hypothetical protein
VDRLEADLQHDRGGGGGGGEEGWPVHSLRDGGGGDMSDGAWCTMMELQGCHAVASEHTAAVLACCAREFKVKVVGLPSNATSSRALSLANHTGRMQVGSWMSNIAFAGGKTGFASDGKKMDAGGQRDANGSIAWHRDLTPNYKQWLEGDQAQEWPEGESKFTPTQVYFTGYFCTVSGNAEGIHDAIVANFARFEDAIKMAGIPAPTGSFISYVSITMSDRCNLETANHRLLNATIGSEARTRFIVNTGIAAWEVLSDDERAMLGQEPEEGLGAADGKGEEGEEEEEGWQQTLKAADKSQRWSWLISAG